MNEWYLVAKDPEGKWERKNGPYLSKQEAEMMKEGMERLYTIVHGSYCPIMEVVEQLAHTTH